MCSLRVMNLLQDTTSNYGHEGLVTRIEKNESVLNLIYSIFKKICYL